jgi:hypothetical protein
MSRCISSSISLVSELLPWENGPFYCLLITHFYNVGTSQIYKLDGFILNLCEICYFISLYCLHMKLLCIT